ncbi:hypothetical protein PHMEG_0006327 [Phytophthora megakarya]|uniref:Peptidase A2 domain-containing protein n=1 Tax=Phytophthora megakarya TaxID=4795 RepID=A0A225WP52_9STRA|nr:hypothetical protein PHMEG_0006327 [Phytophthora megakarya]
MDLLPGEPRKWFRQAKITGKIHNEKAILRLDTGAEVSIVDAAFARKVGCYIDSSQIQDCCVPDGRKNPNRGDSGWITGMFLRYLGGRDPPGLAHGSISLPDKVRIQLSGRRQLYSDKAKIVNVGQYLRIQAGESVELPLRLRSSIHDKLWVTRGDRWVPTISDGPGGQDQRIGIWLAGDHVPRISGFISIGSRRYMEWQNLTTNAARNTLDTEDDVEPVSEGRGEAGSRYS